MGLDLSIELTFYKKTRHSYDIYCSDSDIEKNTLCSIEVAYWRKAWGIRNMLLEIAQLPQYHIYNDLDFMYVCNPSILPILIKNFLIEYTNKHSDLWENSVFTNDETMNNTAANLEKIRSIITFLIDINNVDYLIELVNKFYCNQEKMCNHIVSRLREYDRDKNYYDIYIVIINSY